MCHFNQPNHPLEPHGPQPCLGLLVPNQYHDPVQRSHASTTPGTCLSPTVPSRDRARCSQSSSTLPSSVLHASTNPGIWFSPRRPTVFRLTDPSSGKQQRLDPWDMRPSVSGPSSGSHHPATSPPTQGAPDQHDQMRHRSPARPQEPNAIQTSSAPTTAQHRHLSNYAPSKIILQGTIPDLNLHSLTLNAIYATQGHSPCNAGLST